MNIRNWSNATFFVVVAAAAATQGHEAAAAPIAERVMPGMFVIAQAGSVGGAIGKQGKSASGTEQPRRIPPAKEKRRAIKERPAPQSGLVSGQWRWVADCGVTEFRGEFDLRQASATRFSGSFGRTSAIDGGQIVDGQINGSVLSFTRTDFEATKRTQKWSGTISPATERARQIKGKHTARFGSCRFMADRK